MSENKFFVKASGISSPGIKIRSFKDKLVNLNFIKDVEEMFLKKGLSSLNMMDLGCSSGFLVREFLNRGHLAIGLEDQNRLDDYSIWSDLFSKNLFHCDIRDDFSVLLGNSGNLFSCDLITSWLVADSVQPHKLPLFFENIRKHLKVGGVFIGNISLAEKFPQNETLQDWEHRKLKHLYGFSFQEYPFDHAAYPLFTSFYFVLVRKF